MRGASQRSRPIWRGSASTLASMLYAAARALGLVDLGWKVDLVDRSIRCGEGDPELADALQREAEDKFR